MTSTTAPARPATARPRTEAMRKGRQADSARRRQRVIAALNRASSDGTEISVSGIARTADVDRSLLYRHRDLLGKIHALEATPPGTSDPAGGPGGDQDLAAARAANRELMAQLNHATRR